MHRVWHALSSVFLALLITTPFATAHGDVRGHDGIAEMAPGESMHFEATIHYHRLVGTVRAVEGASLFEVSVIGPGGEAQWIAGPAESLRVNYLVTCCKDATWTDHTFTVRNVGPSTVTAKVDLVLLHDDFAVIAENAEPGASWQTLLIAILLAAIPAWLARRPAASDEARAQRWLRIGWWSLAAAWVGIATLSFIGMVRYGGGPLVGSRVAMAPLPTYGAFVNSYLLVALPMMALWVVALSGWVVVQRRSTDPRTLGAHRLAYTAAVGPLVFGVLFAVEVGNVLLATLLGLVPAALIVAAALVPPRAPIDGAP